MENLNSSCSGTDTNANSLAQLMRRYPLSSFFILAFVLTWFWELAIVFPLHIQYPWDGLLMTVTGPTLAAFIMAAITEGRTGVVTLLRRYVRWRVGLVWYLFALLTPPLLAFVGLLLFAGGLPAFHVPSASFLLAYLMTYLSLIIAGGPFGEEPGWRGFALPRLQQRSGPLWGTLILAAFWALWHLPLYLFRPGYNGNTGGLYGFLYSFLGFAVVVVAFALVFTWVFNNTRGSLLLTILLHASVNTASMLVTLFPSFPETNLIPQVLLPIWLVAAVLIVLFTRGQLGYQRYLRTTAPVASASPQKTNIDDVVA